MPRHEVHQLLEVRPQRRDLFRRAQRDVHERRPEVVPVDRQLRLDAEDREARSSARSYGRHCGTGCVIQPNVMRGPSRSSTNGHDARRRSRAGSPMSCSGCASTNAEPSVGMAGERQLRDRREDADPRVPARLGRKHEHRLREVHLARERPASSASSSLAPVGEDGELVAGQRRVGEDVGDDVAVRAHALTLHAAASASAVTAQTAFRSNCRTVGARAVHQRPQRARVNTLETCVCSSCATPRLRRASRTSSAP